VVPHRNEGWRAAPAKAVELTKPTRRWVIGPWGRQVSVLQTAHRQVRVVKARPRLCHSEGTSLPTT
jgi:hypothetical protein